MPSGIATIAVRGVMSSRTGRSANASTPETTSISSEAARAPGPACANSGRPAQYGGAPARHFDLANRSRRDAEGGGRARDPKTEQQQEQWGDHGCRSK